MGSEEITMIVVTKVRNARELNNLLSIVPQESIVLAPENIYANKPTRKTINLTRKYDLTLFAGGTLKRINLKPFNTIWRLDRGKIVTAIRKSWLWKSEVWSYSKAPKWEGLQVVNNMKLAILNCHELTKAISVPHREIKPLGDKIIEQHPDILVCLADWVENKWYLQAGAHMLGKRAKCKLSAVSNKSGSAWAFIFKRGGVIKERCTKYGFIAIKPRTLEAEKFVWKGESTVQKKLL